MFEQKTEVWNLLSTIRISISIRSVVSPSSCTDAIFFIFYAVSSAELVLDLLESSDGLSRYAASSFARPSASGGAQRRVDLRVELTEVVLGEDGDLVTFLDEFSVALGSCKITVGFDDFSLPEVELLNVSSILGVFQVKSCRNSLKDWI